MTDISARRSQRFLLVLSSIYLQFISGISTDSTNPKNELKTSSGSSTAIKVGIICLVLVIVLLLSFLLFKLWQKKKREEQHARLLKLFEEDDQLELELGLQD